jgi:hypothetical protein
MQGLQALDQFKSFVSKIGGLGRYEDTYIVHAAEGETVVPMEVLDQNPILKKRLFKTMMDMGIEPGRYIVGNELNSKNPVTGQPEFFLKKVVDRLKKAAADVSGYAAPIVGAMYGPAAGALTGGILGSFKRENPGDPTQGLNMAMLGGGAGIASNILGGGGKGTNFLTGEGLSGRYGTKDIVELGKQMIGMGDLKPVEGNKGFDFGNLFESKVSKEDPEELVKILANDQVDDKTKEFVKDLYSKKQKGRFGNLSFKQLLKLYGLGTAGLGFLIDKTSSDGPVGMTRQEMPPGQVLTNIVNPTPVYAASGGVMDLQDGGESVGPGTGTSDSIPAMLSDGEFVMTAKAVRGAGGGDRREGARKMYEAMDNLEARA